MFIKLTWRSINTSVQLIILLKDEEQLFWLVMTYGNVNRRQDPKCLWGLCCVPFEERRSVA